MGDAQGKILQNPSILTQNRWTGGLAEFFFRPADGGLAKSTAAKRNIFFRPTAGGQFCGLSASRGKNVSNVKTIIWWCNVFQTSDSLKVNDEDSLKSSPDFHFKISGFSAAIKLTDKSGYPDMQTLVMVAWLQYIIFHRYENRMICPPLSTFWAVCALAFYAISVVFIIFSRGSESS